MTQLQTDAERFSEFMLKNYPCARDWVDPVGFCGWNISRGYIACVVDEDDKTIVAMCAMRPVDRPGFGVLPFYYTENGNCLHIDLLIDTTNDMRATYAFIRLFSMRFGPREWVTLFRGTEEKLHVYPYIKFWKHLSKMQRAKMKKRRTHYGKQAIAAPGT